MTPLFQVKKGIELLPAFTNPHELSAMDSPLIVPTKSVADWAIDRR